MNCMNITPNPPFNRKLRKKRETHNWTIEEISSMVGVDARTYRRWEHGEQRPRFHSLKQLCAIFESSAEDLGYDIHL